MRERPKIVCLCGSTRFYEEFDQVSLEETLKGNIVLSIGSHRSPDATSLLGLDQKALAQQLDLLKELHAAKIRLADEIIVINVDGYIGPSTAEEISYAVKLGKPVRYIY